MPNITHLSENTLIIYFSNKIDTTLSSQISATAEHIRNNLTGVIEVIPSYTSIFIEYHILRIDISNLESTLLELIDSTPAADAITDLIILPTYYHPDVAPDIISLATQKDLSVEELIHIHSSTEYTVCSTGFAPGFTYLAEVDPRITSPRPSTPRISIPAGSVGIADNQTAVYPSKSPAGWQVIGNCPISLFDIDSSPMTPFNIGAKVQFEPISKEQFIQLGGKIE